MRSFIRSTVVTLALASLPGTALAQTSAIAGTVRDPTGAVLPGVTVEVASPALIEKTRSSVTDGSGQYKIEALRPGTYTVTFALPGFNTVKRDGVELTSDFTATINGEMKVGAVEETVTVSAESPIVDVQNITTRTVMTRDVLDVIPTGRNIQAVGIMIPGANISFGGGAALSRDVGGSGNLQQSPLNYRGSPDTVQTIEGMRLNNLCANGAYSGVYWNEGSFQELSYVTGADSAEMGQGGMRVNLVPRDGGNSFHATVIGNAAPNAWVSDNCGSAGIGKPCQKNLYGDTTFNRNNFLTNVANLTKNYDFNPSGGGPIVRDRAWFYAAFRYLGVNKTVADSFFDSDPSPFRYVPNTSRPGIDDGHIRSVAGRVTAQVTSKDKLSYYHDEQDKVRGHWGIAATVPPEASAIQATPTSFVSVTKWTRTHTNRLLFDGGFAVYDQEYQENYQPEVLAANPKLITIFDNSSAKFANAWNNPADHFSKLFTWAGSASYITGSHSIKAGGSVSHGTWREVRAYTGDVQPVTYNAGSPVSVTLRIPTDRRNGIKADTGIYAQDKWTIRRATINAGLRYDWFIGETLPEDLPAGTFNAARHFDRCSDGKNNLALSCVGTVQNWKDLSPRIGVSYDLFGNGKTAVKTSIARYVVGEQIGTANNANPETTVGLQDIRSWVDADLNGSPFAADGAIQLNELTASATTPSFGKNLPASTITDPATLNGWGKRPYNWEYAASVQHELMPRVSISGGYYRRWFGNQTFTHDRRFTATDFDGPFCITAPTDPNLPDGGGYRVCGLYDIKPAALARNQPQNNLIHFAKDVGGITDVYQGFDVNLDARLRSGTFVRGGVNAQRREINACNLNLLTQSSTLNNVGSLAFGTTAGPYSANVSTNTETFPDGSRICNPTYGFRPDFKLLGSHTLPGDVVVSGTYQFSRGVQNPLQPSLLATWSAPNSVIAPALTRNLAANAQNKQVQLMPLGQVYSTSFGGVNLNQLDLRASKRFRLNGYRFRVDVDVYNVFNNAWPFTLNNTFSTAANSGWLRPTNVLQSRFVKIGGQFDF
jgi:hypothetical protein